MAKPKGLKNREALERIKAATIGAGEPVITEDNYKLDIIGALTYYRTVVDEKARRKWVQTYLNKDKAKLEMLTRISDFHLEQVAGIIRLKEREQILRPREEAYIETKLASLFEQFGAPVVVEDDKAPKKPVITPLQRMEMKASDVIGQLEEEIDVFINTKGKTEFDPTAFIKANHFAPQIVKIIAAWFTPKVAELDEAIAGKDEQLNEGYSFFNKTTLKKYREFVNSIVVACDQAKVQVVKKVRAPRIKSPIEITKRVRFMKEFPELGIKSEFPTKLVNSSEVWLYNTKNRKMTVMRAVDKDVLIVQGTKLVNFDTTKSEVKTLRRPEEFFKTKLAKRDLSNAWKALTTKPAATNGRLTEDTIIVAVF